jgi:hypothetical protein
MKKAAENLSIKLTEVLQEYKTTKLIL